MTTDDISNYTRNGETWYLVSRRCPECDRSLKTNGCVYSCITCDWWTVRDE